MKTAVTVLYNYVQYPPQLPGRDVEIISIDHAFDTRTVMDRSGYPPMKFRQQTWRAHSDIAFPPASGNESATSSAPTTP
jgi:hypothetical protein